MYALCSGGCSVFTRRMRSQLCWMIRLLASSAAFFHVPVLCVRVSFSIFPTPCGVWADARGAPCLPQSPHLLLRRCFRSGADTCPHRPHASGAKDKRGTNRRFRRRAAHGSNGGLYKYLRLRNPSDFPAHELNNIEIFSGPRLHHGNIPLSMWVGRLQPVIPRLFACVHFTDSDNRDTGLFFP